MDSFEWITVKGVKLYVWTKHALNTKMKMTLVHTDRRHFDVEILAHNRDVFFTISSLETGFFNHWGQFCVGQARLCSGRDHARLLSGHQFWVVFHPTK